jgi:hypothetical protein
MTPIHPHTLVITEQSREQVEGLLYKVHRYFFHKHSNHFATVLSLPQPEGQPVEGQSDDNPIEVLGVKAATFDLLLSIFYPRYMPTSTSIRLTNFMWE